MYLYKSIVSFIMFHWCIYISMEVWKLTLYWSVTISRISNENILAHFKLKLKYFRGRETNCIKKDMNSIHIRSIKSKSLFPMPNVIYFRWEAFLYPSDLMSENINTWDNDTVIWNFFFSSYVKAFLCKEVMFNL